MRAQAVLAALAAAVTLTLVAAADPDAARQRVAISMANLPNGTFALTPFQPGKLKSDSGSMHPTVANYVPRSVIRDGQRVDVYEPVVWVLEGKRGTLTVKEPRNEWVGTGGGRSIATGTWVVVRGTGQYAGVTGGGRTAHLSDEIGQGGPCWCAREEGFLSVP